MTRVGAVVLAAGVSSRMGCPKLLMPWGDGPLVARAVGAALGARVDPVVVVLGHRAEEVRRALEPLAVPAGGRLVTVLNPDYLDGGQSSSVRTGIASLPDEAAGAVFVLGDQPLVRSEHIDLLVDRFARLRAHRGDGLILVPAFGGRRGNPVLFGRRLVQELVSLRGDEGGRSLLRSHPEAVVEVPAGEEVLLDVDTREDYERLRGRVDTQGRRPGPGT